MAKNKMDDRALSALAAKHIVRAVDYTQGTIAEEQRQATEYYYGEPYGNEQDGRSAFVTSEVQDAVEGMMPDLMEIFAGSDEPVEFEPVGEEDEEFAKQATEYVSYIWTRDNDGYGNTHDLIKDALLNKNGFGSITWEETEKVDKSYLENVGAEAAMGLHQDPEVTINGITYKGLDPQAGALFDMNVERKQTTGRVHVRVIPPENMLISPAASDFDKPELVGDRQEKSVTELIDEGFDEKLIRSIGSEDNQKFTQQRLARYRSQGGEMGEEVEDDNTRKIWVYNLFFYVDFDGDGRAEYRNVMVAGPGREVLFNEEVDDHPYITGTPVRMPHTVIGRSWADLTMDLQFLSSTLWRQMLDNAYFVNNSRALINENVDVDDWLANRPGGAVRVSGKDPVAASYAPIVTAPLGPTILPLLDAVDREKTARIGTDGNAASLDAEALHDTTAAGMNMVLGQGQKRTLMVARNLAETLFRQAFRKILKLVVEHQDRPRTIRLRNTYVEMDPRKWNVDMDVTINVGLGHGTKESRLAANMAISAMMEKVIAMQGGPNGPLVELKHIHKLGQDILHDSGRKNDQAYMNDPSDPEVAQKIAQMAANPPPDPEMEKIKMMGQVEMAKVDKQEQTDMVKIQNEMQIKSQELQAKQELDQANVYLKGREVAIQEFLAGIKDREVSGRENLEMAKISAGDDAAKAARGHERHMAGMLSEEEEEMTQEQLNQLTESMSQAAQAIAMAAQAMVQAATMEKEIVFNENGDPVSSRPKLPAMN